MLIRNYGLFWRRDWVHWGYGGHLKGVYVKKTTDDPVDFRDQQGVYALYDDAFRLVYVGQAGANDLQKLFNRLKQHTRDPVADRWTKFSWFGVRRVNRSGRLQVKKKAAHPGMGDVLNHIEAILIAVAEPPHNRQGGRFGEKVEQYIQFRDVGALGPDRDEMLAEIWKTKAQTPER